MKMFKNKKIKYGLYSTLISVIFIIVVVLFNFLLTSFLSSNNFLVIDLTQNKKFEVSTQTIDYLKQLDRDVNITVFAGEELFSSANELYKQAYEVISKYDKYSDFINIKYVDLQTEPTVAQQYPDENIEIGDIIIETDIRSKKVSSSDFFLVEQNEYGDTSYSSQAEQIMTSSIMLVNDEDPVYVSILTGLDNSNVSEYLNLLNSNNYVITEQNLLKDDINNNSSVIILAQPRIDITKEQSAMISDFLNNDGKMGKSMIYFADVNTSPGPVLQDLLSEWGIKISSDIIFETNSNYVIRSNFNGISDIIDPEIYSSMKNVNTPLVIPFARAVETTSQEQDNIILSTLAQTSPNAINISANADANFDIAAAEQSILNTVVKSTKMDDNNKKSNVIAIGSTQIASSGIIDYPAYANADFLINLTNSLSNKKDSIAILPVIFSDQTISVTQGQASMFTSLFMIIIPIAILLIGMFVWLRRRNM